MFRVQIFAGCFVFLCLLIGASVLSAFGQTTIFNAPSTDTVPEKKLYFEADFNSRFASYSEGGFQTYGYKAIYGVGKKLEAGTNFFYTRTGKGISSKELQPNFKWKIYANEKYGIGTSTGAVVFVPLNRRAGTGTYGLVYSNASKSFRQVNGLRVTGGIYTLVGAKRDIGTKTGAIIGIEQPLRRKFNFLADWYTGKNRFGYSAAGFSYVISPKQFVIAGYNFGNAGRGNHSFSAFYGYYF